MEYDTVVPGCADRLQGRSAGGGKIEPHVDKWKCLHSVRLQNSSFKLPRISVVGGKSEREKVKTMGMALF
jgi:hypothetical protein